MHMCIVCTHGSVIVTLLSPSTRTLSQRCCGGRRARGRRRTGLMWGRWVFPLIGRSFLCIRGCGLAHGVLNWMLGVCNAVARYGTVGHDGRTSRARTQRRF
jgi:hypothetical protein